jgi:sugar phosphate isomerase/epimerase
MKMIKNGIVLAFAGAAMLFVGCQSVASCAEESKAANPRPEGVYTTGKAKFTLGVAGYTYHKKNIDQTLADMKSLDIRNLCVKDFHLPIKATQAEVDAFKKKCAEHNVNPYAIGPIYMNTQEQADDAFAYAKRLGVKTIVCVPFEYKEVNGKKVRYESRAMCEYLSSLCDKNPGMRIAIHNHGPDIPYLFPNAESMWKMVKDLHPNMGMCFDIGHQFRDNRDPADAIYKYHSRIFDVHLKNVSDNSKKGKAEPLPRGKMDLVEIAQALKNVGYTGCCSLEFERNFSNNYAEIAECIGYFRGVMDSLR